MANSARRRETIHAPIQHQDRADIARQRAERENELCQTRKDKTKTLEEQIQATTEALHRKQEREQPPLSHFKTLSELRTYLQSRGIENASQLVTDGVHAHDPWKYEGKLIDDLITIRSTVQDPELIAKLRDLIWIGSVLTYPRKNQEHVLKKLDEKEFALSLQREAHMRLPRMIDAEEVELTRKEIDALKDPTSLQEHKENAETMLADLELVSDSVARNVLGSDLEPAIRIIENLQFQNWHEIKLHLTAHGKKVSDVFSSNENGKIRATPDVKHLFKNIEDLRHVRDLLYYRRNHPDWARLALKPGSER